MLPSPPDLRTRSLVVLAVMLAVMAALVLSACALNEGSDAEAELLAWYPDHELDGLTLEDATGQNVLPGAGQLDATYATTDRTDEGIVRASERICEFDPEVNIDSTYYTLVVGRLTVPLDCSDAEAARPVAVWDLIGDDTSVVRLDLDDLPGAMTLEVVDRAALREALLGIVPQLCDTGWCGESYFELTATGAALTEIDLSGDTAEGEMLDVVLAVLDLAPPDAGLDIEASVPRSGVVVEVSRVDPRALARLERRVLAEVPGAGSLLTLSRTR